MSAAGERRWSEARIHRWLASRERPSLLDGSQGHDAAVLRRMQGRPVLCTDQVIEGVHAAVGTAPRLLGRKAVARTLSDLAACGASARAVLLALRLPRDWTDAAVRALIRGAWTEAERFGAELVGGDLALGVGPASAAVTALGELPGRGRPPGRDRARPGQVVLCTGPTGGSLLGRHLRIEPRLAAGRALREAGASAMIDVSDGLWLDASRLARASGVRLELSDPAIHRDAVRLARRTGRTPLAHALIDGEDHELLATLPRAAAMRVLAAGLPGARILGRVVRGEGVVVRDREGDRVPAPAQLGYLHGDC
ncbi:thiamine-phosphate kinase [Engelhardtia mirabilis]|uniref:Thiamine-monophosphate kinase n=1 Tax=Engelhardtia mirabilis TaxID=2528011 RepID=A0A518BKR7_9BACT|nr:Thiamine-monophosphate kinase [Planctomycetes bacterium Pla133]QDV01895.1 Thiamine-monophosphate kinase [Planctomycetes bacterium Pla86]